MKMIIKFTSLLFVFTILQGCASSTAPSVQGYAPPSYSPATTNESFIFRSPPPAAVSAVRGH